MGAGGGGASDVRSGVDGLGNRLLVAGGGGGAGFGSVGHAIPSEPGDGGDSATAGATLSSDDETPTTTCRVVVQERSSGRGLSVSFLLESSSSMDLRVMVPSAVARTPRLTGQAVAASTVAAQAQGDRSSIRAAAADPTSWAAEQPRTASAKETGSSPSPMRSRLLQRLTPTSRSASPGRCLRRRASR
jgi:Glycine rich protein